MGNMPIVTAASSAVQEVFTGRARYSAVDSAVTARRKRSKISLFVRLHGFTPLNASHFGRAAQMLCGFFIGD
jgi:hypothetical protein